MNPKTLTARILPLFLLAALVFTLAACGSQSGDTTAADTSSDTSTSDSGLYHLRIAYSPSLCQAPLHIAVEKGFFEAEGIEPEKLKYIWDRYYKLDKSHKRAQIGTGLGLSIVRRVIELHGGKYGVQSTVGEGSVFWFELKLYYKNGENADMEENE